MKKTCSWDGTSTEGVCWGAVVSRDVVLVCVCLTIVTQVGYGRSFSKVKVYILY